jgi:hypothetical protein
MEFSVNSPTGLHGYVQNNLTISPGHTSNWILKVANHMGKIQLVMITTRIGNLTTISPNSTMPASALPVIDRTEQFINDGDIANIGFTWTVTSLNQTNGLVFINMQINNRSIVASAPVGARQGRDFRLIFELWTFDPVSASFEYGYTGETSQLGSWLQIWFNVTS